METSAFHFANNAWLWGLTVIPLVMAFYTMFYLPSASRARLERFADKHLLPHLLARKSGAASKIKYSLLLWSLLWACGIVAMAGPRWNYTDVESFKPQQDMVILLDLSKSMDASDVKPSRIALAREQINDLIKQASGLSIGLVAYAADAHMVSPITDDTKAVLDMVPYLDTTLPYVQGNALKPALTMASKMLGVEPGNNKSILIVSDGDFTDTAISAAVNATVDKNTAIYTLGVGTPQGAPVPVESGGWLKDDNGTMLISHLQADHLAAVSAARGGLYAQADYSGNGIGTILSQIKNRNQGAEAAHQTVREWEEHFILLVIAMAALLLPWFRKGQVFPALALLATLSFTPGSAHADGLQDLFLNKPQQAQNAFNQKDYKKAETTFDTPYRRGVAQYKAGEFPQAEKSFADAQTTMPGAQYNLGNAQVMNAKYADAIATYESVLKREPANANAKHNLDIARTLLEQQKQKQKQDNSKQDQKQESKGQGQNQNDKNGGSGQDKQDNPKEDGQQNAAQGQQPAKQPEQKSAQDQSKSGNQAQSADNEADNARKPANQQTNPQSGSDQKQEPSTAAGQQPMPKQDEQNQQAAGPQAGQNSAAQKSEPLGIADNGHDNALPNQTAADRQVHPRTQKDVDADQWLNRIDNDPKTFLRNQFMIESEVNGTQGEHP